MGFKTSLPYLPSEQGDWRAYFYGDDNRMGENVNSQKGKPIIKKGRVISDPASLFGRNGLGDGEMRKRNLFGWIHCGILWEAEDSGGDPTPVRVH